MIQLQFKWIKNNYWFLKLQLTQKVTSHFKRNTLCLLIE